MEFGSFFRKVPRSNCGLPAIGTVRPQAKAMPVGSLASFDLVFAHKCPAELAL
jgi:hypothetical protein